MKCTNEGCQEYVKQQELQEHLDKCEHREIDCGFCGEKLIFKDQEVNNAVILVAVMLLYSIYPHAQLFSEISEFLCCLYHFRPTKTKRAHAFLWIVQMNVKKESQEKR